MEMKNLSKIINGAFSFGMIQNYDEIHGAVEFILKENISNFLEIGTNQGGTFYAWTCASNPGVRISIDIPHGPFGTRNYNENARNNVLSGYPGECLFISGSSHDKGNRALARKFLNKRKLDFLFIDGDHTELGVTKDLMLYKELVRHNGWIGFHDIKPTEYHHSNNCFVDVLWSKLEGNKVEFVDKSSQFGGIGFIQYNEDIKHNGKSIYEQ